MHRRLWAVTSLASYAFFASLACLALAGCQVDPFCLYCESDADQTDGDADGDGDVDGDGDSDADTDADGDGDGDGDSDADGDTPCIPDSEEFCNGRDDNCDGVVDEGFDFQTNVQHCGRCNNPCVLAHAFNECRDGVCSIAGCDVCYHDLDGEVENGCEYPCCQTASPASDYCPGGAGTDCCDGLDNDCDNEFDEDHDTTSDPNNCGGCSATCTGSDCPFRCDYPLGVAACTAGVCEMVGCVEGHWDANHDDSDGCEYPCTLNPDTGGVEVCNSRDDDCDGDVDESFEGMGEACGIGTGACEVGTQVCDHGHVVCQGEVVSATEVCDGEDNDCDGETDESDPNLGAACGTDMGECVRGTYVCTPAGVLDCAGDVEPTTETCNALDDDCDGTVDDGVPDGPACGTDTGECTAGHEVCLGGRFVCDGSRGPVTEECNNLDDDCDGSVDEELVRDCSSACGVGEQECSAGAWGACSARVPAAESCDNFDNDCDSLTDENDDGTPLTRSCTLHGCGGVETCLGGAWGTCVAATTPETCNNVDDDCDGSVDESLTRTCGNEFCPGEQICTAGAWGTCSARTAVAETCNGIDDDCDGDIDEDATGARLSRSCSFLMCTGTETCTAAYTWSPCTATASSETCNNRDDDCDGSIDESLVRGCSSICGPGEETCTAGTYGGCTAPLPGTEVCDGDDNDCDGSTDEGLTRACSSACGTGIETCTGPAVWSGCTAPLPVAETCNGRDDDCDGSTDEDFIFASDPYHCGNCTTNCYTTIPHAVVTCSASTCRLVSCLTDWWDINPAVAGCEYNCHFTGSELCNGVDDDCDGAVDTDWVPAANYCGNFGVCASTTPTCTGVGGPVCTYPATYQTTENRCDGLDNDCDGLTDEGFSLGGWCPIGEGLCQVNGHYECDPGNPTGDTICVIDAGEPDPDTLIEPEICDGLDNDCNGVADDAIPLADMNLTYVTANVDLDNNGTVANEEMAFDYYVFQYEASHPDASDLDAGSNWTWACSNDGVLPWGGMSWRDAQAACCGLNTDRACHYQGANTTGTAADDITIPMYWSLCTAPSWEVACQVGNHPTSPVGVGAPYYYPYESDTYNPIACNGADAGSAGVETTGFYGTCAGGAPTWTADSYDMSGNLHEWTWTGWYACACDRSTSCTASCACDDDCACACDTDRGTNGSRCQYGCACDRDCNTYYEYRGGSYNSGEFALQCQWDFNLGSDRSDDPAGATEPEPGLALESIGFRCCYYPAL